MLSKIWAIAYKDLYITFTDRSLIIIMILIPLAISTIVGLAFGGLGGEESPIENIPVALINLDEGTSIGVNYGMIFGAALIPDYVSTDGTSSAPVCDAGDGESSLFGGADNPLYTLTDTVAFNAAIAAQLIDDGVIEAPSADPNTPEYLEQAARAAVEAGQYAAMVYIPSDYSARIAYIPVLHPQIEPAQITVYANAGLPVEGSIVRAVVEGINNQVATGNITMAATFAELQEQFGFAAVGQLASSIDIASAFACAFTPSLNTVEVATRAVGLAETRSTSVQILVAVGASQAMFFALFTAQFGVLSMYDERRAWTLQRILMSPTPRHILLAGKLIGVYLSVLFQLVLLMVSLSLVASFLQRELIFIWGTDVLRIVVVLLAATAAVSGFGMLLSGIVRTPEQAQTVAPLLNTILAVLGGAFGFRLPDILSQLSMVYWGSEAFDLLSVGTGDVSLHVIVLLVQGIIMFALGIVLFSRRFEMV
ncbi:MAG: hypothetical protein D6712_11910 [Chloroflexi bacterium]|nr:MAG: hypothetical protein D6712_11910 [Chloroflexota bacterium]